MASLDPTERAKIQLTAGDQVRISTTGQCTVQGLSGAPATTATLTGTSQDFGPYGVSAVLLVTGVSGRTDYSLNNATYTLTAPEKRLFDSLVSEAGKPFDTLAAPLQQVTITGAISTTGALTATATGTYRKARIAWNNNGASGTAKLRIAANTDNDVHGLVAGQSAKRRDYELTMGDAVTLVCAEPITRLTFSADGAITSGTHSIQVTFGS